MRARPTILVSGYGPWAKAQENPAAQIAANLSGRSFDTCKLVCVELSVDSSGLHEEVNRLIDQHKPDAWKWLA